MKINYTSLIVTALAFIIFSCSKKNISSTNHDNYKKYSQQLEMNYESDNSILSASANENEIVVPKTDSRFETVLAQTQSIKLNNGKRIAIKKLIRIDRNNPLHSVIIKKLEGPQKDQNEKKAQVVTGKLRTGIILAAVGLLLLVTAQFFGAASPVIYVAGAVLVIVGVVLILLDVL